MKLTSIAFATGLILTSTTLMMAQLAVPAFEFTDLEDHPFSNDNLDQGKSTLIIYFDPWCEHCNQQAAWIAEESSDFRDVQVLFITFEPEKEPIEAFRQQHFSSGDWSHVVFLQDLDFMFESYFGYTDDPLYIYCYKPGNRNGTYFGKEQPAEVLLNNL